MKSIRKQLDADETNHAEERLLKQALRSHPLPPTDSQVLDSLSIPVNLSEELTGSLRQMRVCFSIVSELALLSYIVVLSRQSVS
jgi:hypothetical protein